VEIGNEKKRNIFHLRASAGMEKPRVMKSPSFNFAADLWNKLCKFSLRPMTFCRFFFSFSSSRTLAVSMAVAAFLIPDDPSEPGNGAAETDEASAADDSSLACFFRFLDPGAFLRE
jgi:hypothetical protein